MNPNTETRSRNVRSVVFWIRLDLALGLSVLATQGPTFDPEGLVIDPRTVLKCADTIVQ